MLGRIMRLRRRAKTPAATSDYYRRNQVWVGSTRLSTAEDLPTGVTVDFHDRSIGNIVRLSDGGRWRNVVIDLSAAIDCVVEIGAIKVQSGGLRISFVANGGRCSTGTTVSVGRGSIFNGSMHIIGPLTPGLSVSLGENGLFATNVSIRGSSHHALWDLETGALLNPEVGIAIGDRVWLGDGVVVLNRAVIPSGSVVGARSVVNKAFAEENTLLVGAPAIVRRRNIAWANEFPMDNGASPRA